jgi:diacylglycerol O-acyltransferase
MKRLSAMDAAFLYTETSTAHMHVVGTMVLDPSTVPGGYSFERLQKKFLARVLTMERFRQRLVEVPLGLDHPCWVEDATIDPRHQVRRLAVAAPGGKREFADQVSWIAGQALDRRRPLWEIWVLEGLEEGRIGLVFKIHHCMVDGASGAATMTTLFDLVADTNDEELPERSAREAAPGMLELLGAGLVGAALRPLEIASTLLETATTALPAMVRAIAGGDRDHATTLPFQTPATSLSASLSAAREVAFAAADLEDARKIRRTFGVTVNDVVLAACTQSLRNWLEAHGELPDRPLVASVPVNTRRSAEEAEEMGNQVSVMFVALPVHLGERLEQLRFIHEDAGRAKQLLADAGPSMIGRWAGVVPPWIMAGASRLYSRLHLADMHRPVHSVVISNVAGPTFDLFAAGARVEALYPLGPVMEGAALNMTVLSQCGKLDLGVVACPRSVHDVQDIADGFRTAIRELALLADRENALRARAQKLAGEERVLKSVAASAA